MIFLEKLLVSPIFLWLIIHHFYREKCANHILGSNCRWTVKFCIDSSHIQGWSIFIIKSSVTLACTTFEGCLCSLCLEWFCVCCYWWCCYCCSIRRSIECTNMRISAKNVDVLCQFYSKMFWFCLRHCNNFAGLQHELLEQISDSRFLPPLLIFFVAEFFTANSKWNFYSNFECSSSTSDHRKIQTKLKAWPALALCFDLKIEAIFFFEMCIQHIMQKWI